MRTEQIKKLLCVLCLGLPVVLGAVAMAQSQTPSILDRVQRVEDPELGDLIRLAMENRKKYMKVRREEAFEIVRKVTQSYSQIKLLDLQIEQIAQRVLIIKSGQIIVDESLDLLLKSQRGAQCAKSTLEEVFIGLHSDPSGGNDE